MKSDRLRFLTRLFISRNLGTRDVAVDQARGLAIIAMIIVNHAPPTEILFSPFVHAAWTGWSVADTIFPAFLFIVGLSISYFKSPDCRGDGIVFYSKLLRRFVLLMIISLVLVNFPYYELATLKIHGTLIRIGVCYFVAVLVWAHTKWKSQVWVIAIVLALHAYFLTMFHVPGVGRGALTPEANASAYIDTMLFGEFAERLRLSDPVTQGLLPTAASIATTLIGVVTGNLMRIERDSRSTALNLFAFGLLLFIVGLSWGTVLPISKPLWSPSYVIAMAGVSMQAIAFMYWSQDRQFFRILGKVLQIAGANALFFYVFAQSLQRVLVYGKVWTSEGTPIRLRYYIFENWFQTWLPGKVGALLYTLCFLAVAYSAVYLLYRRRIFIKL